MYLSFRCRKEIGSFYAHRPWTQCLNYYIQYLARSLLLSYPVLTLLLAIDQVQWPKNWTSPSIFRPIMYIST